MAVCRLSNAYLCVHNLGLKYYETMEQTLYKYPSTPHLPLSKGRQWDDTSLDGYSNFIGRWVVITEKMDGENASLYPDHYHARSLDSRHHSSRDWIKSFWGRVRFDIPSKWRFCGENLYAAHSVPYDALPSYFMLFSVWDHNNRSVSWDDVEMWAELFGIETVPVLYKGIFDKEVVERIAREQDPEKSEGFVIRNADSFHFDDFAKNMGKYVRVNHVQTDTHWMHAEIVPNKLKVEQHEPV